jgi:serum/glucocorticoid-regulated kinase 2
MEPVLDDFNETEATDTDQEPQTDADRTDGEEETATTPSQSRSSSIRPQPHLASFDPDVDVFDGYSFKGRHSVLIDDEEEEDEEDSLGEGEEGIEEVDEDSLSILEGLEEETVPIGESRSVVIVEGEGGDNDDASDGGLLEDEGVELEPKTPEARPAATLLPIEEVNVVPVAEEVVMPVTEEMVPAVVEEVMPAVAEEVVAPIAEVEETISGATKMEASQVEPKVEEEAVPASELLPTSRSSVEEPDVVEPLAAVPSKEPNGEIVPANDESIPAKELNGVLVQSNGSTTPPTKTVPPRQLAATRAGRSRREKSGVAALDRYLSDGVGEATEAERDEDDDWDFVEAADGEDRNGAKGTSLFARGVVDRYRLAVFRKASTPTPRSGMRIPSGMSNTSGTTVATESPSPTQRRGRTPGLTFRKNPRQFLRPKSPPSSFSAKTARSLSQSQSTSTSNIFSTASTSSGGGRLLSASHSVGSTFALSPSLKSKESAISVGAHSQSSDQSVNGTSPVLIDAADTIRVSPQSPTTGAEHKVKNKKLRRYKHNAEKVFSLFSSPRQAS